MQTSVPAHAEVTNWVKNRCVRQTAQRTPVIEQYEDDLIAVRLAFLEGGDHVSHPVKVAVPCAKCALFGRECVCCCGNPPKGLQCHGFHGLPCGQGRPPASTLVRGLMSLRLGASPLRNHLRPPESRGHAVTAAVDMVTSISRCISSATVEIIKGGRSCPSRSPSGCIVHALTAAVDMVTSISRCISSATVEIIEGGGSCPSRSPSGCIVSEPSKPPSPSVYIVSESTRPPLPMVCVVKVWSPSFCVTSSKRTASPAAVHVVTEGQAAAAAESHPFITRCHIVVA
ncbi:hypothetical protein MRX96_041533 [Rhipicephalus microplus]